MTMTHHTGSMAEPGEDTALTVGQVAERFGVTVRTLHHYDDIGLLVPSERTAAGYRLYTERDLVRLAAVVTYRRLGMALTDVQALLDGRTDVVVTLTRQKEAVLRQVGELHHLADAIDRILEAEMSSQPATETDLKTIFGDGFDDAYRAEAQQRWGESDAWKQSAARTKGYTKADWAAIKAEADALNEAWVAALTSGQPPTSPDAMKVAEAARLQIHTRYYDCSPAFHRNLADMYLADPRFTTTYEDLAPGLAQFVHDAIHANADRIEGAGDRDGDGSGGGRHTGP